MLARKPRHFVVVDEAGGDIEAVLDGAIGAPGEIDGRAVGQVAAMGEAHAQHAVTGIEQREVDRGVRLGAGMRLHVRVIGAEQRPGPVNRELFDDIDVLATAIVTLARVSLGVLVRQYRALGFQHAGARVVLRGDQLDVVFLALPLVRQRLPQFGIEALDAHVFREQFGILRLMKRAGRWTGRRDRARPLAAFARNFVIIQYRAAQLNQNILNFHVILLTRAPGEQAARWSRYFRQGR